MTNGPDETTRSLLRDVEARLERSLERSELRTNQTLGRIERDSANSRRELLDEIMQTRGDLIERINAIHTEQTDQKRDTATSAAAKLTTAGVVSGALIAGVVQILDKA